MEDSSPPDQEGPLSAGDLLAEPKARLTNRVVAARPQLNCLKAKRRYGDN
jgi:hypothetical protein